MLSAPQATLSVAFIWPVEPFLLNLTSPGADLRLLPNSMPGKTKLGTLCSQKV